jgi:hypothetical protein
MIQTHQQLHQSVLDYNSLFSKNEFYPIQKAYSTPHFIVLVVRFAGVTKAIYIGRGNQYQGFYVSEKMPPAFLRTQDRLLDFVRKYLVGARIGKALCSPDSMVFHFNYKNISTENYFLWGYKDRQLFFSKLENVESAPFAVADRPAQNQEANCSIENYLHEQEKKAGGANVVKKMEKFLLRKKKNIEDDFNNALLWKNLLDDLEKDKLDLSASELKVHGQKFKFQKSQNEWDRKNLIYNKIKRLKTAETLLSKRLIEVTEELNKVQSGQFEFSATKEKTIQPIWEGSFEKSKKINQNYNVISFKLNGVNGVLGLDAHSNDWIRHEAAKEHWWFHIENQTGAHCILKTEDFSLLSFEDLGAIASMLRDYSKLSIVEIPVMYAQVKNIKGVKGSAGKVVVKKPKYLRCVYQDWNARISIIS